MPMNKVGLLNVFIDTYVGLLWALLNVQSMLRGAAVI